MFRKFIIPIFVCSILFFSSVYAKKIETIHYDGKDHIYTGPEVSLVLKGDPFEITEEMMQPIILENRTLVPVREVFETLGGKVDWDATTRRVDVSFFDRKISLWIDKLEASVDGEQVSLDVPAKIINSKTMVPVRFISERAGLQVDWEAESKTVSIQYAIAPISSVQYQTVQKIPCLVVTGDSPIAGYKYYMLKEDGTYRLILDIENSLFKIPTDTQTIEDELVSTIRFGVQENNVNRVVLDLKKDTDYIVVPSLDKTKLYFAMATEFAIEGETVISEKNDNRPGENSGSISEPNGDNQPAENNGSTSEPNGDNQPAENNGSTSEPSGDNQPAENNGSTSEPSGDSQPAENNGSTGEPSGDNQSGEKNGATNEPSGDNQPEGNNDSTGETSGDNGSEENNGTSDITNTENQSLITSIKYNTISKRLKVGYEGELRYQDNFYSNPNRIVIDFELADLKVEGPTEFFPKNNIITSVRFSQYNETTVRVVLDLSEKADYKIYERSSEIQIAVKQPTYKNISYKLNTANAQITLTNVRKSDLSCSQNKNQNSYTIKYAEDDFESGEGELTPEDAFVKEISISSKKIVIYDNGDMVYTIRQSGDNVVITIKKEEKIEENEKRVILIDAGHGGNDPGACNGSAQEKVFNLNIALYLYDLLSEREDIEVFLSRDDDQYLDREDRLAVANKIQPDFIVSVHNNSLENKSYTGTMVLYYNNPTESQYGDITSKECAQIVVNKLVEALDTVNRGVVSREDLHILSKTPCPSILCEICFVSNDAELERLKTKAFQKSAAEAIYEGVLEILEEM